MSDSPASSGLLDLDHLSQFAEAGIDDFAFLLDEMMVDVRPALDGLREALEAGDSVEFKRRAHSLRGMLANFGCAAMARRLYSLEHDGGFPSGQAADIAAELETLWEASESALREWMASQ